MAEQKESRIEEGHLMSDHVHMPIAIPPKHAVSQVVGYIKGKSAIHLARVYGERKRSFVGQHFWARGYFVSTVGRDEEAVRKYIREQEDEDKRLEQMDCGKESHRQEQLVRAAGSGMTFLPGLQTADRLAVSAEVPRCT